MRTIGISMANYDKESKTKSGEPLNLLSSVRKVKITNKLSPTLTKFSTKNNKVSWLTSKN